MNIESVNLAFYIKILSWAKRNKKLQMVPVSKKNYSIFIDRLINIPRVVRRWWELEVSGRWRTRSRLSPEMLKRKGMLVGRKWVYGSAKDTDKINPASIF